MSLLFEGNMVAVEQKKIEHFPSVSFALASESGLLENYDVAEWFRIIYV